MAKKAVKSTAGSDSVVDRAEALTSRQLGAPVIEVCSALSLSAISLSAVVVSVSLSFSISVSLSLSLFLSLPIALSLSLPLVFLLHIHAPRHTDASPAAKNMFA